MRKNKKGRGKKREKRVEKEEDKKMEEKKEEKKGGAMYQARAVRIIEDVYLQMTLSHFLAVWCKEIQQCIAYKLRESEVRLLCVPWHMCIYHPIRDYLWVEVVEKFRPVFLPDVVNNTFQTKFEGNYIQSKINDNMFIH